MMKKRVFYPLLVVLILLLTCSVSLIGYITYLNLGGTTITIKNSDETTSNIEVSKFNIIPGETKKEDIYLVSTEKNTFDISLNYTLLNDGKLQNYVDISVEVDDKVVVEKVRMNEIINKSLSPFTMDLSLTKKAFTLVYSMDESIGNEAYQTSMSFNLEINVKRSLS